jgi:hypothetical protein
MYNILIYLLFMVVNVDFERMSCYVDGIEAFENLYRVIKQSHCT